MLDEAGIVCLRGSPSLECRRERERERELISSIRGVFPAVGESFDNSLMDSQIKMFIHSPDMLPKFIQIFIQKAVNPVVSLFTTHCFLLYRFLQVSQ